MGEAILLIIPVLLSVTLFADSPGLLCLLMTIPPGLLLMLPRRESGSFLPSALRHSREPSRTSSTSRDSSPSSALSMPIPPLPALTTYRAHMLLLTFICILAVDFPVFPRELAKCETYGVSLVSVPSILRLLTTHRCSDGHRRRFLRLLTGHRVRNPSCQEPSTPHRSAPTEGVFGIAKVLSGAPSRLPEDHLSQGYRVSSELCGITTVRLGESFVQEHVTEYGVHWNFFITLGLIPLLQVLLHPLMVYILISLLGVVVAVCKCLLFLPRKIC